MSDLADFHQSFIADIQGDADALGLYTQEAFFEKVGEILTEAGEIDQCDYAYFQGSEQQGRRVVHLQVSGYGGDPAESDGVLSLILCDFQITPEVRLTRGADLKAQFNKLVEFLRHARREAFRESLEETSLGAGLADLINTRWNGIEKIKLIFVTNSDNRAKVDAMPAGNIDDKPVTYNVWDLKRLQAFVEQGKARADLTIDFAEDFGGGIPVLKASGSDAALESYIAVIPGSQLAAIYDKWGARLLESNVRSFLQARGNVNKGIRKTILEEPHMFLAYNNGLAATAESVELAPTEEGLVITKADNLQIVNGGQTTASIHAARKLAGEGLKDIFVQMKLSVVPPILSDTVVPRISEFANSQNKVNAADFFANHPFHIKIEELSRKILAPVGINGYRETKWFYERARGQYADERSKKTPAERKKWDAEFPRRQFFTKTDLAKFENTWSGKPHMVSLGAQKNFADFAKTIEKVWGKNGARINEAWYRHLISKAIIFRKMEKLVSAQDWYEGGYRANIVTYAIAKVARDAAERDLVVDLSRVWRSQDAPATLEGALLVAAAEAQEAITNPPEGIRNMSEWAKKQACWEAFRKRELSYPEEFGDILIEPEEAKSEDDDVSDDENLTKSVEAQTRVFELGGQFWAQAKTWGRSNKLLSPSEYGVLDVCSKMPTRIPTEKQSQFAIEVLNKLMENGFRESEAAAAQ
ncbi:AIPR family protein [Ruegeria sp. YS9]|uniref:AIPR family protein n=1 Tax=Ruegeria sp. YS9 TaxID=2966453 RepID=UPI00214A9843|nr:AIPR family protein [Ruegeria sp. YS9]UUV06541.1 AIPR family protein [Ruegeria sp. YS9]